MSKSKYVNFLEGILVGGSLGAAVTFMFGTKEGKKLQQEIVKKYKLLEHKAEGYQKKVKKAIKSPVAKKLERLTRKAVSQKVTKKIATIKRKLTHKKQIKP